MRNNQKILKQITWLYIAYLIFLFATIVVGFSDFVNDFASGYNDARNSTTDSGWVTLLAILVSVLIVLLTITTIKLFVSSTVSVLKKDIFNDKLIRILTRFAILSLTVIFFMYFVSLLDPNDKREFPMVGIFDIVMDVVFILIFSRVLTIGKVLKEEQDLTV